MKRNSNELTERERITIAGALILDIMGEKISNKRIFEYAHPEQATSPRTIERHAGTLMNSTKVQEYRAQVLDTIREEGRKALTEYEQRKQRERVKNGEGVDFTNREEFIQFLNATANSLTNEKDKRDYLKMIADLLRLKEDTPDKSGEIMKFYTPVSCSGCQIKAQFAKIRAEKGEK